MHAVRGDVSKEESPGGIIDVSASKEKSRKYVWICKECLERAQKDLHS